MAFGYAELKCNNCKQGFMLTSEALKAEKQAKKCPYCSSPRFRPTGNLGMTVNRAEAKTAIESVLTRTEVQAEGEAT